MSWGAKLEWCHIKLESDPACIFSMLTLLPILVNLTFAHVTKFVDQSNSQKPKSSCFFSLCWFISYAMRLTLHIKTAMIAQDNLKTSCCQRNKKNKYIKGDHPLCVVHCPESMCSLQYLIRCLPSVCIQAGMYRTTFAAFAAVQRGPGYMMLPVFGKVKN